MPVAIVNPRRTRKFAAAVGRLAKTDAIDAAVIAHFAEAGRPEARPLADAQTTRLAAVLARRMQLLAAVSAEQQRHDRATEAAIRASAPGCCARCAPSCSASKGCSTSTSPTARRFRPSRIC